MSKTYFGDLVTGEFIRDSYAVSLSEYVLVLRRDRVTLRYNSSTTGEAMKIKKPKRFNFIDRNKEILVKVQGRKYKLYEDYVDNFDGTGVTRNAGNCCGNDGSMSIGAVSTWSDDDEEPNIPDDDPCNAPQMVGYIQENVTAGVTLLDVATSITWPTAMPVNMNDCAVIVEGGKSAFSLNPASPLFLNLWLHFIVSNPSTTTADTVTLTVNQIDDSGTGTLNPHPIWSQILTLGAGATRDIYANIDSNLFDPYRVVSFNVVTNRLMTTTVVLLAERKLEISRYGVNL